jgi:hypothetical protein
MNISRITLAALTVFLTGLSGCGGGDGGTVVGGIGGTGKIASGSITGFGSIFVNGIEYDTASAVIQFDDDSGSQAELKLGMVVTVTGTVNDSTGTASQVVYDNVVEGPVSGLITPAPVGATTRQFVVLGTTVLIDATTTVFGDSTVDFGFNSIDDGNVVEVSGFFDSSGVLHATYIDRSGTFEAGTTEVELKGVASNASGPNGTAGFGDSFTLNGITINILSGADLSTLPGGVVSDGMFVEAKGRALDLTRVDASRVEREDIEVGEDGDEVSVQGFVSGFIGLASPFFVGGRPVDATTATLEPVGLALANDLEVEAEGTIDSSGTLIAETIEVRGGDLRVQAKVNLIDTAAGTIRMLMDTTGQQYLTVQTDSRTQFEDKTGAADPLRLGDIGPGDYLEIGGYLGNGGAFVASEVRRDDPTGQNVVLQGPVSEYQTDVSLTVLGVTMTTQIATTEFEDGNDQPLTSAEFYSAVANGPVVKLVDQASNGDGVAEEASLED